MTVIFKKIKKTLLIIEYIKNIKKLPIKSNVNQPLKIYIKIIYLNPANVIENFNSGYGYHPLFVSLKQKKSKKVNKLRDKISFIHEIDS